MWHWLNQLTFFGLVALAGAVVAWRTVWFAHASRSWPTTPARIDYLGLSRGKNADQYRLIARYSYAVNGITYESTRWRFGSRPNGNMPAITLAVSTQIKPIDPVVFYDPDKPDRSCLVAGSDEITLAIPIAASILAVGLLVFGIVGTPR